MIGIFVVMILLVGGGIWLVYDAINPKIHIAEKDKLIISELSNTLFSLAWADIKIHRLDQARILKSGVDQSSYNNEALFLHCFAIDFAIVSWSKNNHKLLGNTLRDLWLRKWLSFSNQGNDQGEIYSLFIKKCREYGTAIEKDIAAPQGAIAVELPSRFAEALRDQSGQIPSELIINASNIFHGSLEQSYDLISKQMAKIRYV